MTHAPRGRRQRKVQREGKRSRKAQKEAAGLRTSREAASLCANILHESLQPTSSSTAYFLFYSVLAGTNHDGIDRPPLPLLIRPAPHRIASSSHPSVGKSSTCVTTSPTCPANRLIGARAPAPRTSPQALSPLC